MVSVVFAIAVWWWAFGSALDRLAERGESELSLASDRLVGQLQKFRQLAVVMSDHPGLYALLLAENDQFFDEANHLLLRTADKTGSYEIFVAAATGLKIASSRSFERAENISDRAYFQRAMYGALGTAQAHLGEGIGRAFYFAAPIKRPGQVPIGAIVVKVDIEAVETDWRADPNILFFTDQSGVVFVSNRDTLLFSTQGDINNVKQQVAFKRKYGRQVVTEFPKVSVHFPFGHEIWRDAAARIFPPRSLHLTQPLPVIDLTAEILLDTSNAGLAAYLQAMVALTASLIVGAGFLILIQRRMALSERFHLQESAKRLLEDQVQRRTEQLSGVNLDLRQQIKERIEAEIALKNAQQDLVQVGKLSALGQMSAGISHELNQPLMAIRSFAENAEKLIELGQIDTATANLARISELARRMGRIIKNLRAFSRKEGEPLTNVDLGAAVAAALELSEKRLADAGVSVDWTAPEPPLFVRGGEVRLQQVIMNLLSNAIDAMDDSPVKRVEISTLSEAGTVRLMVRDTGPGLSEPEKIFDPFYTTKTVGQTDGMGLGLSISYGIVQSFGGKISGRNHPNGGSVFTVELTPVAIGVAA